ncbi:MAG: alpha/beta fold hydrolase [Candidatus Electronema sp. VV]
MKKNALALTAFLVSVSCLQSTAWSTSSLLMQMPAILAAAQKSDTTQIMIGENGIITAFKGKTLRSNIKIYHGYALAESTTYEYSTVTGPSGLSVSADGVISYAVPASADTQSTPVSLRVKEKATGKSYTKNVQLVVMATEIIASGTVGPTGGQITDEFEEVVVTVPEGAVEGQTLIEVLRAVDENGYYTYTINASAPLLKILQMRLPDPILRKAPEESLAALQSKKAFQQFPRIDKAQLSATAGNSRWFNWHFWPARYIEITTGINAENRLKNDLPDNIEPEHPDIIHNTYSDASELISLCSHDAYDAQCGSKDPVVFIHGYTAGGDLGGGADTWGQLPELIAAEGYAVFEFKWRTNARFEDVAADFADAIKLIQEKSHKKVHIIAHSFGGLVSRTYLQNYAFGRPYQDNVQSLLTLGTPHSGIFDSDGTYHNFYFKKGQDSTLFEGCLQLSCQEAGEPTPKAWTIKQLFGPDISMSSYFGININPGELIAKIQNTSGVHTVPVDINTLIGIYVNRQLLDPTTTSWKYSNGDGLITYAGQRFSMTWGDNKIHTDPEKFNSIEVTEKILGITDNDSDAIPLKEVSQEIFDKWHLGVFSTFVGYFHSPAIPSYLTNYFAGPYLYRVAAEAYVDACTDAQGNTIACENFHSTHAPHAALTEIKTWLKSKSSELAEPTNITLNLKVVDADTQQPVSEAEIYFDIGSSCTAVQYVTDAAGNLSVTLPFYPAAHYTALVRADGYRSDEFDTGYVTGATPELSGTEFGTIRLQKGKIPTVTSTTGRVWMDRNLGASRVATSMTDTEAYGDLYQWGRLTDGHEKRTSGTTTTLSATDNPSHGNFITATAEPYDWRSSQNDNLWQGVNGVNNPCPTGFRLPTADEWQAEMDSWSSKDADGAFSSPLKITLSGNRSFGTGSFNDKNVYGNYWTSVVNSNRDASYSVSVASSNAWMNNSFYRATAISVRCIKD